MEPATATLLAASIGFAGQVVSAAISKSSTEVSTTAEEGTTRIHRETVTIVQEQVLNKEYLRNVIKQTAEYFSKLLDEKAYEIIEEMRSQAIKEAVQEVRARVNALHSLLNLKTTEDPNLIMQLVTTALNPLQVSIEIAKLRLKDYGHQEAWQYCYIIGTSTLIAGYAFINQDMPHLREELETVIWDVKSRMLDDIARRLISSGKSIPWERIPRLMASEGNDDLLEFFTSTIEQFPPVKYDINKMTVDEIRVVLYKIPDKGTLKQMLSQEKSGKKRSTAIGAIEERITQL